VGRITQRRRLHALLCPLPCAGRQVATEVLARRGRMNSGFGRGGGRGGGRGRGRDRDEEDGGYGGGGGGGYGGYGDGMAPHPFSSCRRLAALWCAGWLAPRLNDPLHRLTLLAAGGDAYGGGYNYGAEGGGGGGGRGGPPQAREGDWACPDPGYPSTPSLPRVCFSVCRVSCVDFSHPVRRLCRCGNVNWARRSSCNKCNTPKPGGGGGGGGGGYGGRGDRDSGYGGRDGGRDSRGGGGYGGRDSGYGGRDGGRDSRDSRGGGGGRYDDADDRGHGKQASSYSSSRRDNRDRPY
jgi:RNA-binding protein FUS